MPWFAALAATALKPCALFADIVFAETAFVTVMVVGSRTAVPTV